MYSKSLKEMQLLSTTLLECKLYPANKRLLFCAIMSITFQRLTKILYVIVNPYFHPLLHLTVQYTNCLLILDKWF